MAITEKYASSAGAGSKDGSTEGNAWDWETMLTTAAAGDRINFKGDHTLGANATFSNAGTATSPIILRGYKTTIGDLLDNGRTNGNGPLITTDYPVITGGAYNLTMPNFSIIETMKIVVESRNAGALIIGGNSVAHKCYAQHSGTGSGAVAITCGTYSIILDCDAVMSGASGGIAAISAATSYVIACRADGGQTNGIVITSGATVAFCTIFSSGGDAILVNSANNNNLLLCNTLVSSTSDGLHQITGATRLICSINNLITDNGAYGIYAVDAGCAIFSAYNRINRNTSGVSSGATDWLAASGYGNNTTSANQADEFPGYASDDYRLGSTSPARQNGVPDHMDIGSLQRIEDYPAVGNVTADDTVDGATGTYHEAAASEVQSGVQFGAGGTEYTGTYSSGGGGIWMPRPRQIGV